jgi:dipeptidyl-peptidase-4
VISNHRVISSKEEAVSWKLRRRGSIGVGLLLLLAAPIAAAKKKIALSDLTAQPPILGRSVSELAWQPGGKSFSYILLEGTGEEAVSELWTQEAASGRKRLVVSGSALVVTEEPKQGEVAPRDEKQPGKSKRISLEGYRWSPDGRSLLLSGDNDLWLYRVARGNLERITRGAEEEEFATFSPDGSRVAFVRNGDLWLVDLASGVEKRLTSDGSDLVLNGRLDWVYEEELGNRSGRAYQWSPDGAQIAYLRLDDRPIDPHPITDFLQVPAKVTWQRYPEAGAKNPVPSFRVVGVDGMARGGVDLSGESYVAPSFSWTPDAKSVCYRVINRAQTREEVRLWTLGGATRVLFVEEDPYWINDDGVEPPKFLRDGRFLWKSEKSGYAHLYVGRVSGGPLQAITRGDWMVDHVAGVDEEKRLVYFTATEENVRRRPIYRVGLDGRSFARLTAAKGTHSPELSSDGRYLLDTYSAIGDPTAVSLLDSSGQMVRLVHRPQTRLAEYDLAATDEVEIAADDGARLMARLTKPSDFDPGKKYPVIVRVYGGPHEQVVRDAWGAASLLDHLFASRGYLVWSLDNRGSWGRGHAWETAIFKGTGRRELADQLTGVRYLKSLPYVDSARIGIWGWSYGGYMTLYGLTNAPDVWKCGVAGAPVTHWKFYDTIYTERYMRTPQENPTGYEASAPLSKAKDLKAKVLIIHGTADDNVHMQNSVAFMDALVKEGKQCDLKLGPGQEHGFRGKAALDFRNAAIVNFFEENL